MNTVYKYIQFNEGIAEPGHKTRVWVCRNRRSNAALGVVAWETGWRQYVFHPYVNTIYSSGCSLDIAEFLKAATEEQRQKAKEAREAHESEQEKL